MTDFKWLLIGVLAMAAPLRAAPPLQQLEGTAACVSDNSTGGGCVEGVALDGASAVALSPNGRSVYVVSAFSDAVVVFDREVETGVLTQKAGTAGCISVSGTGGACVAGTPALNAASRVAARTAVSTRPGQRVRRRSCPVGPNRLGSRPRRWERLCWSQATMR